MNQTIPWFEVRAADIDDEALDSFSGTAGFSWDDGDDDDDDDESGPLGGLDLA